jgi:hypothetical protein
LDSEDDLDQDRGESRRDESGRERRKPKPKLYLNKSRIKASTDEEANEYNDKQNSKEIVTGEKGFSFVT